MVSVNTRVLYQIIIRPLGQSLPIKAANQDNMFKWIGFTKEKYHCGVEHLNKMPKNNDFVLFTC